MADLFILANELYRTVFLALHWVSLFFIVHIINRLLHMRLNILGIYPRRTEGVIGIVFSPLLHGDFQHLFWNMIPLFVFSDILMALHLFAFWIVTVYVWIVSGLLVWLCGRRAIHIGASGLVMGYFAYLLIYFFENPSLLSIVMGAVCLYYFGSLIAPVIPFRERESFEGHIAGMVSGVSVYFLLQHPGFVSFSAKVALYFL